MKKEEFPTFLNEQPTILFGRTGRELLLVAAGGTGAFSFWNNTHSWQQSTVGMVICITIVVLICILSLVVALVQVAGRPLEEWFFVLLFYFNMPKIYVFMPLDEDDMGPKDKEKVVAKKVAVEDDPFDEANEL